MMMAAVSFMSYATNGAAHEGDGLTTEVRDEDINRMLGAKETEQNKIKSHPEARQYHN